MELTKTYEGRRFEIIYGSYDARYRADPAPAQSWKAAYYNDTDCLDLSLFEHAPWRAEVWALLKQARGRNLEGLVSVQETEAWRDRCLSWFDGRTESDYQPLKYISPTDVEAFVERAVREIETLL